MKKLILLALLYSIASMAGESTGTGNGPDLSGIDLPINPDKIITSINIRDIGYTCNLEKLKDLYFQITGKECRPVFLSGMRGQIRCELPTNTNQELGGLKAIAIGKYASDFSDIDSIHLDTLSNEGALHIVDANTLTPVHPYFSFDSIEDITVYDILGRAHVTKGILRGVKLTLADKNIKVYYQNTRTKILTPFTADIEAINACFIRELNKL